MYFVDLPQNNTTGEHQTLATFPIEQQAIDYAMKYLGADEHGNINVISDDGDSQTIQTYSITYGDCQTEYESIIEPTSSYEISIDFYPLIRAENADEKAGKISYHAFYSTTEENWHLVGQNAVFSTYEEIVEYCLEQIKLNLIN